MRVSMTENKTSKVINLIKKVLNADQVKVRLIASLIGKINATKPANKLAFLYTKWLEQGKNEALIMHKYDFEKNTISGKAKKKTWNG